MIDKIKEMLLNKKVLIITSSCILVIILFNVVIGIISSNYNSKVVVPEEIELSYTSGYDIFLKTSIDDPNENITEVTSTSVVHTGSNEDIKKYNVYIDITSNEFTYSKDSNTTEVLLTIKEPDGKVLKELGGFKYVTIGELTGFDITDFDGLIKIEEDYEIVGNDKKNATDVWEVEITFINLETNQSVNLAKELSAKLYVQDSKLDILDMCTGKNLSDCFINYSVLDESLIHHTSDILTSAEDNNYRYSGGNDIVNNYVCFGTDNDECADESLYRILGFYNINGEYKTKLIKAYPVDKNEDEVYNISEDKADTFAFDEANSKWEGDNQSDASDDADINIYLNTDYYINNLDIKYQNMIDSTNFNIGTARRDTMYDEPKYFYLEEVSAKTVSAYKMGLPNPSDYLFAASTEFWELVNFEGNSKFTDEYYYNDSAMENNWMYLDINEYVEWTMNAYPGISTTSLEVWNIDYYGRVTYKSVSSMLGVRPVVYLNKDIVLESGEGTLRNPFIIK